MSRTLLVQHWSFYTARVREANRQDFTPSDLGGIDLLDFVAAHLRDLTRIDRDKQRWTSVRSVEKAGERAILVTAQAGAYNEPGDVVDVTTGAVSFSLGTDHAATSATRSLIIIPDSGLNAIAFFERSTGRGTSGLDLMNSLRSVWRERQPGITWSVEWLEEADAWLQAAKLKAVQVRRYAGDRRTADSDVEELGEFVFGARAKRNRFLRHRTLEQILEDPRRAHELIGHQLAYETGDRVFVELHHDGKQKTYALDGGKLPKLQMSLQDGLTDDAFLDECINQAATKVFPGLGAVWNSNWAHR